MSDGVIFDRPAAEKIKTATQRVLSNDQPDGAGIARFAGGRQCITAKITAQDTDDVSKFAWQQEIRTTDGSWIVPSSGLVGTVDNNSAYALDPASTEDLTDQHVMLALMAMRNDDGDPTIGWIIVGGADDSTTVIKIGANVQDGTNFRWTYTGRVQKVTGTGFGAYTDADSTDVTVINDMEIGNASAGATYPIGVLAAHVSGLCQIVPLGPGALVHCKKISATEYHCCVPNSIDQP